MDVNIENSGEENNNYLIRNLDLNPDGVIRPFVFEPQHSSSSGEEETSVEKKLRKQCKEKHLHAHVLEIASGALAATVKRCQQKTSV